MPSIAVPIGGVTIGLIPSGDGVRKAGLGQFIQVPSLLLH
jgi:hypothetical protein